MGLFKKKPTVEPADFLALRGEMMELRARLEATEQDKATLEARLTGLDATASAFISERGELDDLRATLDGLRARAGAAPDATQPAGSTAGDPALMAKVDALHSRLNALTESTGRIDELATKIGPVDELSAKLSRVDELEVRLSTLSAVAHAAAENAEQARSTAAQATAVAGEAHATATASEAAAAQAALAAAQHADTPAAPIGDAPAVSPAVDPELVSRLAEVEQRIAGLAARAERAAASPPPPSFVSTAPPPPNIGVDANPSGQVDLSALAAATSRIDDLDRRMSAIDSLTLQINQLNARVSAQAELGGQVSGLRDRISLLQEQAGVGDELREQVNRLSQRTGSEDVTAQIAQLAQRISATDADSRSTRDQVTAIEQRLAGMGTELANQISELGRDIDALGNRPVAESTAEEGASAVTDELIESLRASQVKLANEQARYEIAFRQDLATLAEQVRRGQVR